MDVAVVVVFAVVYAGMAIGRVPGLALDRTGVALLGAIAMVALGALPPGAAWASVDMPTLYLLFALMVVSAQFRLAGFYSWTVRQVVSRRISEPALLGIVIGVAGLLSAVLTNDVICFAMTPVLVEGCTRRQLDPVPFLLGLACAANVGSGATLIGNPQNILVGEALSLRFGTFLLEAGVPVVLGLVATWAVIARQYRGRFRREAEVATARAPVFDRWQVTKGALVLAGMVVAFLVADEVPRHGVALVAAGLLLLSRRMGSREMLGMVDWQLLVLFVGLFVVHGAFERSGAMDATMEALRGAGVDVRRPAWLFGASVVLSNLVSNVPATMLLLPSATHPSAGPILALSSTLAGNFLVVGSIANVIVVAGARPMGVEIDVRTHARTGAPVALVTLAIAAAWLWLRS